MNYSVTQADAIEWLNSQPADSIDLVFSSPPYEEARLYLEGGRNVGIARKTEAWVAWMVEVWKAAQRACRGLIAFVVEGQTRKYRYSAGPLLLAADLHRAGFNLRKPPAFVRVGIPGGGGNKNQHVESGGSADWLRNDYEFVICTSRPGKLPWADVLAMGHAPKWAPGGEMSHRLTDGTRRNQWGMNGTQNRRGPDGERQTMTAPSHEMQTKDDPTPLLFADDVPPDGTPYNQWGHSMKSPTCGAMMADGKRDKRTTRPSHKPIRKGNFDHAADGSVKGSNDRDICAIANPGNVIVCNVGGGQMGHALAHENEAPFPLSLAEFFVRSFCPPGGLVADPFTGSGTTGHAAIAHGRNFIGCDLRSSQVDLALRRLGTVTPPFPEMVTDPDAARRGAGG